MANCCYYNMRVFGKPKTVIAVYNFINDHSPECEIYDSTPGDVNLESVDEELTELDLYLNGWAKWSCMSAWNMDKYRYDQFITDTITRKAAEGVPLDEHEKFAMERIKAMKKEKLESPSLLDFKDNVSIEIFSEEAGMGFAEHYILINGGFRIDDCRNFYEHYDEENDKVILNGGYMDYDFNFDILKKVREYNNYVMN